MADLASLGIDDFRDRVGETFRARTEDGGAPELALAEVEATGEAPAPEMRVPFSLIFRGPSEPFLPQQIHLLEHAEMGELEIFLVPLGPDGSGHRYQAIFS